VLTRCAIFLSTYFLVAFIRSGPRPLGLLHGFVPHPLLLCANAHWRLTRLLPAPCALLHGFRANTAALLRARKKLDPSCVIITSLAPSCNICTCYSRVLPCFIVLALRLLLRCTWELHLGGGNAEISGDSLNFFCNLLLHGSVKCTIVRPTVVTCWLTLPFLALNLVASVSVLGSTSFLWYFFVHLHIEVTWHCFLWALLHAVRIFPRFTVLHMRVRVCPNE